MRSSCHQKGKKSEEASEAAISDFKEHHTENSVQFELILTPEQMAKAEQQGFEKMFKLKSSLSTSNMVLFDHEGKISKYNTALDILKDFCKLRRQMYDKRKAHMVAKLSRDKEILSNKARFILMVVKGELELRKRKKADLLKDLQKRGFKPMSELDAMVDTKKHAPKDEKTTAEEDADGEEADAEKSDYDYLLGMNLWSLTFEKVEEIKKQLEIKEQELRALKAKSIETMWDEDLKALSKGLDDVEALEAEEAEAEDEAVAGRRKKAGTRDAAGAKRKVVLKAASRKRSVVDDSIDEALMSRPLQVGAGLDDDEVQKQSWGHGAPPARQAGASPEIARGEPDDMQEAGSKGRAKGRKVRREGSSLPEEDSGVVATSRRKDEPPEPAQEEGGGSLLSRLLKNKSAPGASLAVPSSGFSALSGSDDFFSYLSTGQDTSKPYDALDFGAPPCGEVFPDPVAEEKGNNRSKGHGRGKGRGRGGIEQESCLDNAADMSEKGPGRSRKRADGNEDTGGPAKRQKKDTAE